MNRETVRGKMWKNKPPEQSQNWRRENFPRVWTGPKKGVESRRFTLPKQQKCRANYTIEISQSHGLGRGRGLNGQKHLSQWEKIH